MRFQFPRKSLKCVAIFVIECHLEYECVVVVVGDVVDVDVDVDVVVVVGDVVVDVVDVVGDVVDVVVVDVLRALFFDLQKAFNFTFCSLFIFNTDKSAKSRNNWKLEAYELNAAIFHD